MSIENKIKDQKPFSHQSVLLTQCIEGLHVVEGGVYVAATLGGGGHALSILESAPNVRLYGIDRDPQAMSAAKARLSSYHKQCTIFLGTFSDHISDISEPVDGILFDLGVSSPQLDQAHRGFSFSKSGPLDMRMNPQKGLSAADIINNSTEKEIADIIYLF